MSRRNASRRSGAWAIVLAAMSFLYFASSAGAVFVQHRNSNDTGAVAVDSSLNVWVSAVDGVRKFPHSSTQSVHFTRALGTELSRVSAIVIEPGAEEIKWFIQAGYLIRLDDQLTDDQGDDIFTLYGPAEGVPGSSISAAGHSPDSATIALAMPGVGVATLFHNGTPETTDDLWETFTTADGMPSNEVLDLAIDPLGKIWAIVDDPDHGLVSIADGVVDLYDTPVPVRFVAATESYVYAASPNDGAYYYVPGTPEYDTYVPADATGTNLVDMDVVYDDTTTSDKLFFAINDGDVDPENPISEVRAFYGDATETIFHYTRGQDLEEGADLRKVVAYVPDGLLVGTGGGVHEIDDRGTVDESDDALFQYSDEVVLHSQDIHAIHVDGQGNVWFGGSGVVTKLEREDGKSTWTNHSISTDVWDIGSNSAGEIYIAADYVFYKLRDNGTPDFADDVWVTLGESYRDPVDPNIVYRLYTRSVLVDSNDGVYVGYQYYRQNYQTGDTTHVGALKYLDDGGTDDLADDFWYTVDSTHREYIMSPNDWIRENFHTYYYDIAPLGDGIVYSQRVTESYYYPYGSGDQQARIGVFEDGTYGLLFYFNDPQGYPSDYTPSFLTLATVDDQQVFAGNVRGYLVGRPTLLWIDTNGTHYDRSDDTWKFLDGSDGLDVDGGTACTSQRDSAVWTEAHYGRELCLLEFRGTPDQSDDAVRCIDVTYGDNGRFVQALEEAPNGTLWIGTNRGVTEYVPNVVTLEASLNPDNTVLVEWNLNPEVLDVVDFAGINLYRATSYNGTYDVVNYLPLPGTGSYLDTDVDLGRTYFYWLEVVDSNGGLYRDDFDRTSVTLPAPGPTFELAVRETTKAGVVGSAVEFDVQVRSVAGYSGTVALNAAGLPPGDVESVSFDPPTVEVPGRSTVTITWDPLLEPPVGGYAYPFQIEATDVTSHMLLVRTVNAQGVVIDPSDHYLTQFVHPAQPEAGHDAEVFGRLTPAEEGQMVFVTTGGSSSEVFSTTTTADGYFSLTVPVDRAGTLQFDSSVGGTNSSPYVAEAQRGRRRIRMTAESEGDTFGAGDLITLNGDIEPNPGPGEIYLAIVNPDSSLAFEGPVSVDDYGAFTKSFYAMEGVSEVSVEFAGDADFFNASASLNIPVAVPVGLAVVVAGGGETANPLWSATGTLCDRVYEVYRGRLIPEERIRYLHPDPARDPDGDGTPEVAASPTLANLRAALETWAPGLVDVSETHGPLRTPLTLYLTGVEESPGVLRLNDSETLTSAQLGSWLDIFKQNVVARFPQDSSAPDYYPPPDTIPVNVVLEFRRSGLFMADLAKPGRIIVTSTGRGIASDSGENNISADGTLAFSQIFHDNINEGQDIAYAWEQGWWTMVFYSAWNQCPLLDANGNGDPHDGMDQQAGGGAVDTVLEYRDIYERRPAVDLMYSGGTIPDGESAALIWAKILDYGETIDRVRCVIVPPPSSSEPNREYRMQYNPVQDRWELHHDGFHSHGLYRVVVTAIDEDGDKALPQWSVVDVRADTSDEDQTPPADVIGLSAQALDGAVALSWIESSSDDVAGYNVYRRAVGGEYGSALYAGNGDHFTVTGLTNGVNYVFKITAFDEVSNESAGVEIGPVTPRGAAFAADATEVLPNTTVQFTDLSTGSPIAWSWDLDGDLVADSAAQHPSYLYTTLGTYTVTLTATYADGSDQETKASYISVQGQVARFSAVPTHGTLPMSVQFADDSISESAITGWSWDFNGDAVKDSADQHPSHQYDAPGEYNVTLTVTSAGGSDSETKEGYIVVACPSPDPAFTSDVTSGPAPLDVAFTSTTEAPATGCDPTAWAWTFGDSGTGSGEVAQHTYTDDGLYDVCLTVTVPGTSAQTCVVDYIDVGGGCASGNLCLTLLLAGYWDGTEQSTEAYLTVDFYADPEAGPSYRITGVQLDMDGTAVVDLTAAGIAPGAYYVVARPLNHLDLMSESALTVGGLAAAGLDADFTDPTQVACGEAALVFVGERWCAPGGDASGDGQVDLSDYSLLAQQWGLVGPEADFTGDAVVDLSDYSNLAQYWTRQMCGEVPGAE